MNNLFGGLLLSDTSSEGDLRTYIWKYHGAEWRFARGYAWGDFDFETRTGPYLRSYEARLRKVHAAAGVLFDFDEVRVREGWFGPLAMHVRKHVESLQAEQNRRLRSLMAKSIFE